MIKGNKIEFGYGDVFIEVVRGSGEITFYEVENKVDILHCVDKKGLTNLGVKYKIICKDIEPLGLYKVIRTVAENNKIVEYNGITFDFTNYKQGSVDILKKNAFDMVSMSYLMLAQNK